MEKEELHFATDENKTRDLVDACCGWSPYDQSRHRLSVYVSLYVSAAFANVLGIGAAQGFVRFVVRFVVLALVFSTAAFVSSWGLFDGRGLVMINNNDKG